MPSLQEPDEVSADERFRKRRKRFQKDVRVLRQELWGEEGDSETRITYSYMTGFLPHKRAHFSLIKP